MYDVTLALFRKTVLGVFSLHRESIAHRDIKHDNIRYALRKNREIVVPIDLGTAIDLNSNPIGEQMDYSSSVGAPAFSPIEARCGLAHIRSLSTFSDIYALGCLLHDLFNTDFYFTRLARNPGFQHCFTACQSHMMQIQLSSSQPEDMIREWNTIISLTKGQVTLPPINSSITTVPPVIRDQLNLLLHRLTDVDYNSREIKLDKILRIIDSCVRSLNNRLATIRQRKKREERKMHRELKEKNKQRRLESYLQQILLSGNCHDSN